MFIDKRPIIPKVVPHVHFHVIPKPEESDESGLVIGWPMKEIEKGELQMYHEGILKELGKL